MATPRKNKSGTWSIRVYSHTDEQKRPHQKLLTAPSKAEVLRKAALWTIDRQRQGTPQMTVKEATEAYAKDERLSPADRQPLASYAKHWETLEQIRIDALTDAELQRWVDSLTLAPSSVRTIYGYLLAVIHSVDRRKRFDVRLPRIGQPDTYTPTTAEIRALIEAAEGDLRLAVMLAAYCTLRRGEVLALERSDLEGNILHITKARVTVKGGTIVKEPKTPGSVRDIPVPDSVRAEIESREGRLVGYTPIGLSAAFRQLVRRAGVHPMRFHDLRHYSASIMHAMGVPDVYIQKRGGWSSPAVLRRIYINELTDKAAEVSAQVNAFFDAL